jgi:S-adenosylmethionine:tRNA ribosyltransferase-isomerase
VLISELDYELPPELIAQEPASDRSGARLLVPSPLSHARHATIADLPELLPEGALVVVNDTRVIPARLLGAKEGTGGKAEIFLLERESERATDGAPTATNGEGAVRYRALGRASKGLRPGAVVRVGSLRAEVEATHDGGQISVHLTTTDGTSVPDALHAHGRVPLPPYIRREDDARDRHRYQTIFAERDGAVAAPTAGLHLTPELVTKMRARGMTIAKVTLHVGLGTFQPVTVDDLDEHPMHAERFFVDEDCAREISRARDRGVPVVAIGTTTVRALESAADADAPGRVKPQSGSTRLLIQPGYHFRICDFLLTNFHLPRSTLLALVCAFAGKDLVLDAYRAAVADRYRFFSYGDAMLLSRASSRPLVDGARA